MPNNEPVVIVSTRCSESYLDPSSALRRYNLMHAIEHLHGAACLPAAAWTALAERLEAAGDLVLGQSKAMLADRSMDAGFKANMARRLGDAGHKHRLESVARVRAAIARFGRGYIEIVEDYRIPPGRTQGRRVVAVKDGAS